LRVACPSALVGRPGAAPPRSTGTTRPPPAVDAAGAVAGAPRRVDEKVNATRAAPRADGTLRHKSTTPAMTGKADRAKISTKFTAFLLCGMAAHPRATRPQHLVQRVRKLLNFRVPSLGHALGPFAAGRAERGSVGRRSADRAAGTVVGGAIAVLTPTGVIAVLTPTGVKALNRWTDGCNHRLGELAYAWMARGSRFDFATTLRRSGVPVGPGLEPRFLGAHHPPSERSLQRRVPFGARQGVTFAPGRGAAGRGRGRLSRKSCRKT
jgi:hypothetical protein